MMNKISRNSFVFYIACISLILVACRHQGVAARNVDTLSINIEFPLQVFVGELVFPKVIIKNKSSKQLAQFFVVLSINDKEVQKVKILNGPCPGGRDIISNDKGFKMEVAGNIKLEAVVLNRDGIVDAKVVEYVNVTVGRR